MKVLFNCHVPFSLAHGGMQIQIEQTKAALEALGVEVEWLRWWDARQSGDLIHFFGTPSNADLDRTRAARLPFVNTTLLSETCNRTDRRLRLQGLAIQSLLAVPFAEGVKQQLSWRVFRKSSSNIVGLQAEREVLEKVYRVETDRIAVVPLGLSAAYLDAGAGGREQEYLICTGTINEAKNCITLAKMARAAHVPILFVGKPYHENEPYWARFKPLIDHRWVKYHPHVSTEQEMIALLQASRGFVLMSNFENWCLSAHEAAACGLPLLVQDQKWSRERFGSQARYFPHIGDSARNIEVLREFYADAPRLSAPDVRLFSWREAAEQLLAVYERVLRTSR